MVLHETPSPQRLQCGSPAAPFAAYTSVNLPGQTSQAAHRKGSASEPRRRAVNERAVATWLVEAGSPPRDLLCEQGFNGKAFTGGHGLPGLYKTAALPPQRDLITPGAEGGSSLGGDWVGAGDGDLLVPVTPGSSVRDESSGRGSVGGPRRHAPSQFRLIHAYAGR